MGVPAPRLAFLEGGAPALYCAGARRPALVIARSAVDLLDGKELRAALAHELAHLDRLDPGVSWLLMAGRALMFFNPAFQVVARAMARDAEWRADERAAAATGDRLALASGLLKLFRATEGRPPLRARRNLPLASALSEPIARARALDVEVRCRRLLEPAVAPVPFGALRLCLAAAALSALLFFVV
jgi:Zn-dependent protease with chaperone function